MKKILLAISLLFTFSCGGDYGEEYNMLAVYDDAYATSYGGTESIQVITTLDKFDAKPIGMCDWISLECGYTYVYVDITENKSTEDRECFVEVYNDRYNLRDTFLVHQWGVFVPSDGGNGGGSGVGGGSGTNETKLRCAARTKKGTRCKRYAEKGSIYCWQHKK